MALLLTFCTDAAGPLNLHSPGYNNSGASRTPYAAADLSTLVICLRTSS